ncbi:hypothetical protein ACTMTI_39890 [Nonomuraea sp. H19]|uniref:hypothetical protein n=1 Tax=Nonomuraea sp. H19 TaxID=3452206 RepID=UPI003F89CF0B
MRALVHSHAQAIHQLAAQPPGDRAQENPGEAQYEGRDGGNPAGGSCRSSPLPSRVTIVGAWGHAGATPGIGSGGKGREGDVLRRSDIDGGESGKRSALPLVKRTGDGDGGEVLRPLPAVSVINTDSRVKMITVRRRQTISRRLT